MDPDFEREKIGFCKSVLTHKFSRFLQNTFLLEGNFFETRGSSEGNEVFLKNYVGAFIKIVQTFGREGSKTSVPTYNEKTIQIPGLP